MQYGRKKLVVVCNELVTVRAITDTVAHHFELAQARDARTLQAMIQHEPAPLAIMVDMAAIQVDAIKLLEMARNTCPSATRILLTDFCDLRIIVEGLHTGMIQRIVYKPIYGPELLGAIGIHPVPAAFTSANHARHIRAAI